MRSGTLSGLGASGWTAISSPDAFFSIRSSTLSRYSSRYWEGSNSLESESMSCWAILTSRSETLSSLESGRSSSSSCGTTSSWKIIVSIISSSPAGRIATSCSLERMTTRAIATLADASMAFSSSP